MAHVYFKVFTENKYFKVISDKSTLKFGFSEISNKHSSTYFLSSSLLSNTFIRLGTRASLPTIYLDGYISEAISFVGTSNRTQIEIINKSNRNQIGIKYKSK